MEIADLAVRALAGAVRRDVPRNNNAIDGVILPEPSESDLEKLDVLLGHRKIMLNAIAALRGGAAENIAEPVPASAPIPARWRVAQIPPKPSSPSIVGVGLKLPAKLPWGNPS